MACPKWLASVIAVAAYGEALKEDSRQRVPVDWAICVGSQGVGLAQLARRAKEAAIAERAFEQIATAPETLRPAYDVGLTRFWRTLKNLKARWAVMTWR